MYIYTYTHIYIYTYIHIYIYTYISMATQADSLSLMISASRDALQECRANLASGQEARTQLQQVLFPQSFLSFF